MNNKDIMIEFMKSYGFNQDCIDLVISDNEDLEPYESQISGYYMVSAFFNSFTFTMAEFISFKREFILNQLKG